MNAGALLVAFACLAWGIDNNLTRKLASADPLQIAMIKGAVAGSVNLSLSLAAGARACPISSAVLPGAVGFLGYGVSLVLFVAALRHLGTARTGAYFSFAPFVGAVLGIAFLGEPVTWTLVAAGGLMALGLYLHLAERHSHEHMHEPIEHEHGHIHDEHHQHPACDRRGGGRATCARPSPRAAGASASALSRPAPPAPAPLRPSRNGRPRLGFG